MLRYSPPENFFDRIYMIVRINVNPVNHVNPVKMSASSLGLEGDLVRASQLEAGSSPGK